MDSLSIFLDLAILNIEQNKNVEAILNVALEEPLKHLFFLHSLDAGNLDLIAIAQESKRGYHLLEKQLHHRDPLAEARETYLLPDTHQIVLEESLEHQFVSHTSLDGVLPPGTSLYFLLFTCFFDQLLNHGFGGTTLAVHCFQSVY